MKLRYATVTGVARDDLEDEGAWLYAETVRQIHALNPDTGVELLIPDFSAKPKLLRQVFDAQPQVLAHNIETVPRLFGRVRPQGRYRLSLEVLAAARELGPDVPTKSGLMVGLGERDEEIREVLRDLREHGVQIVTLGQYLRPTRQHEPVDRYVEPEAFEALAAEARAIGFATVYAGVFVRSSYNAFEVFQSGGAH
jgi:lipoic acid synthetase